MPSVKGWITPDSIPTDTLCRVLLIPDDPILYAAVSGALLPLIYADNWEQVGDATPAECAEAMYTLYAAFVESVCYVPDVTQIWYEVSQNTGAENTTAGTQFTRSLNTIADVMGDTGISLNNSVITIPAGNWHIRALVPGNACGQFIAIIHDSSNSVDIARSPSVRAITDTGFNYEAEVSAWVTLTEETNFVVSMLPKSTATNGGGRPANFSGVVEVYTFVEIIKLPSNN